MAKIDDVNKKLDSILDILQSAKNRVRKYFTIGKIIAYCIGIATILEFFLNMNDIIAFFSDAPTSPFSVKVVVQGAGKDLDGHLILHLSEVDKEEKIDKNSTIKFRDIPVDYFKKKASFILNDQRYELAYPDSQYVVTHKENIQIAVKRNETLCCITGTVQNSVSFLQDVSLRIGNQKIQTDEEGHFAFRIPEDSQKEKYVLTASMEGYEIWKGTVYPATRDEIEIILRKNKNK